MLMVLSQWVLRVCVLFVGNIVINNVDINVTNDDGNNGNNDNDDNGRFNNDILLL